jgi:hypothetical protein
VKIKASVAQAVIICNWGNDLALMVNAAHARVALRLAVHARSKNG